MKIKQTKGSCNELYTAMKYKITNYYRIYFNQEEALRVWNRFWICSSILFSYIIHLKEALFLYGPVSIGISVSVDTFGAYKSGIWDGKSSTVDPKTKQYKLCDSNLVNHDVLLVGNYYLGFLNRII